MFYTLTFNPAIDYVIHTDEMRLGVTNRSKGEEMYFGGKGINVSIVLRELGIHSKALGFTAGFTGEAIEKGLDCMGIDTDFVRLEKGNSRINVKIKSAEETELNGQGPDIDEKAIDALFQKLDVLSEGDTLILAGTIPSSLSSDIYERILEKVSPKKVRTVVDATNDLLINVLKYKPFLIKPNNHELGEMFGVELKTEEEIEKYARKLQNMGAVNVLVSMAGEGALLIDENGTARRLGVCKGIVKNSVGAGDSMVAGFMAGLQSGDYEYALKLGTAAGGATAFSDGLATKGKITELLATL
ncbi:MAG: 1-phosphofructokinase [Eubacterium sp.]|nr:1-phosphofructokinase [Eubacterium sp.]